MLSKASSIKKGCYVCRWLDNVDMPLLGGGCIYVYNCFLVVYIVCIFAGLVMVGSGGLGRTISNQVGCWQPNLGQAFSGKALVYESAMTVPRINRFSPGACAVA